MSSSFPHDPTWGNRSNAAHVPDSGPSQGGWPPQMTTPSQGYSQQQEHQQQTYLNNNVTVKPPSMYAARYVAHALPFQQPVLAAYSTPSYGYPSQPTPPAPAPQQYSQPPVQHHRQQVFEHVQAPPPQEPATTDDPWNWGWDESSSDSPATSTPNNNWGSHTSYNSVQNYFQPSGQPNRPRPATNSHTESRGPELESALTVENVEAVDPRNNKASSSAPESVQSFQSGSNVSDVKPERVSPEPPKIPLTTQALREFHNEVYENGPTGMRYGPDGLTPQWSIESQMSQETASDDISPSIAGGSDADSAPLTGWQEEVSYNTPEVTNRLGSLRISDGDAENREVIIPDQQRSQGLPPSIRPCPTEGGFTFNNPPRPDSDIERRGFPPRGDGGPSTKPQVSLPDLSFPSPPSPRPLESFTLPPPSVVPSWPSEPQDTSRPPTHASEPSSLVDVGFLPSPVVSSEPSVPRPPTSFHSLPPPPISSETHTIPRTESLASPPTAEPFVPRIVDRSFPPPPSATFSIPNRSPGSEDTVNLETIPDNKERPDVEQRAGRFHPPKQSWYGSGPENQEVAPHGDRNQYLETGRLMEQDSLSLNESGTEVDIGEHLPPPGLSRLVTGEGQHVENGTPPPGLDRMVLGQINEGDHVTQATFNGTPPPAGLDRMVLGQLTDEPAAGLRRMVTGESSSPEAQPSSPPPEGPREARVVPGVARDDQPPPTIPVVSTVSPVGRRQSLSPSPEPQNRLQPQTERSETIGSDHVDVFPVNPPENNNKSSKRRDKERLREDVSSDERDSGRRPRDGDYYRGRDRDRDRDRALDRDDSPSGDRRRVDWDRRRRSPQRYYRDDRRRRRDYEYSDDEDGDASGYYSDRDRRNMSNVSAYRDDYDRTFPRRDDRARSMRPERSPRDRVDERRDGKDRRRGGYERDRERDVRQNDYYRRRGHDEGEDYRDQRSRPSSRNDTSVHDFKHRGMNRSDYDRDSERDHRDLNRSLKRERDQYYPQVPGAFNYDPAMYYYYQQYYENMRRTNPTAYAEYYRKYYASSHHGTYSEDRGSVHSGRSSANEESKDRTVNSRKDVDVSLQLLHPYYQPQTPHVAEVSPPGRGLDSSLLAEEPERQQRLTPTKFTTAHVKGILTVRGQLIKILAHYPLDGQPANIDIYDSITGLEEIKQQLQEFPGPLVKGVTHKNNVVRYCKLRIKEADCNSDLFDKDSYKLIWELLILLLRQNGTVVGTDISELLMSHRSAHPTPPSPATSHHSINEIPGHQSLQEEEVTNKFRDLLIYGNTKEALEWAMKHGLWGHALFLASKMDPRTYASVMTRFANGLPLNDPLQTLYQLMSGRQPAAVTCCLDEKWGDWRAHLAMILSNPSGRPELDQRAITALGDSLGARGALHAAHFCYLMAQVEFGSFPVKSSKIVLIGSPHSLPFHLFATNEAIFATEIFEFACNLGDADFVLQHLQSYKLLLARRLAEVGMVQEAVHYAEVIATTVSKQPSLYAARFIQEVYDLGSMLKFSDPVYTSADNAGADPPWLQQLLPIISDYQAGVLQHHTFGGSVSNLTTCSEPEARPGALPEREENSWNHTEQTFQPQQQQQQPQQWHQDFQSTQSNSFTELARGDAPSYSSPGLETSSYWTPSPPSQWQPPSDDLAPPSPATPPDAMHHPSGDYFESSRTEAVPTITMPGTTPSRQRSTSQSSDGGRPSTRLQHQSSKQPQQSGANESVLAQQQGSGWFGGIWNKFTKKPTSQMILPDDKNPAIIWDSDKKRWIDQNGDGDVPSGNLPPPPKAMSPPVAPVPSLPPQNNANNNVYVADPSKPPPASANLYKMSRGKNFRANYVDVMNPGGKPVATPTLHAPDLFPSLSYPAQPSKLFVPTPSDGQDNVGMPMYMPSMPADSREPQSQGLSRWSSSSSLSREVQRYTIRKKVGASDGPWNNGTLPRANRPY